MDLTDGRTEGFRIDNTSWRGQGSVEGVGDRILEDDKELVRKLDQIWISNTKLQVNIPKYSKRDNDFQREKAQSKQPTPNMQRSYADVLKGTRREVLPAKPHRSTWQQRTTKKQWTGLEFTVNKEDSAWLDGYYVGTTRSVELIPTMQEKLYMEGYFACTVKPMGGRLMLLSSEDKDELKDWWRMQQIGLASDDSTSRKLRFDIVRVLISTSSKDFISKSITIKVSGQFFNIVIKEEEASNGLFSMKSDHVIFSNSNSDGDDMVSWSICSDPSIDIPSDGQMDLTFGNMPNFEKMKPLRQGTKWRMTSSLIAKILKSLLKLVREMQWALNRLLSFKKMRTWRQGEH
ncbi:hypothetical protein SLEP1_g53030 [Rubroshorea leprosula]|uniref:PH domain-containing protein n=1 Tax=Rubroshorea leprosula TaxID=152421 RepID=A0AAV5M986_9ROSI|nr:hypothetical protein SLEP1_g53030 [Rubroshorea leprosula]